GSTLGHGSVGLMCLGPVHAPYVPGTGHPRRGGAGGCFPPFPSALGLGSPCSEGISSPPLVRHVHHRGGQQFGFGQPAGGASLAELAWSGPCCRWHRHGPLPSGLQLADPDGLPHPGAGGPLAHGSAPVACCRLVWLLSRFLGIMKQTISYIGEVVSCDRPQ